MIDHAQLSRCAWSPFNILQRPRFSAMLLLSCTSPYTNNRIDCAGAPPSRAVAVYDPIKSHNASNAKRPDDSTRVIRCDDLVIDASLHAAYPEA